LLTTLIWSPANAEQIAEAVVAAREAFVGGIPLDVAIAQHVSTAPLELPEAAVASAEPPPQPGEQINWSALIASYHRHKISSGEVKASTWQKVWAPRMIELEAALHRREPPADSRELLEVVTHRWALQPGARGRQIQVQQTAAMLRWAVDADLLSSEWAPPLDLAPYVGRKRSTPAPTTPMAVEHIRAMAAAIPDDSRLWPAARRAASHSASRHLSALQLPQGGQPWQYRTPSLAASALRWVGSRMGFAEPLSTGSAATAPAWWGRQRAAGVSEPSVVMA
jgi:hypothetical protein